MINPVQTSITQPDGSDRYVIIEPILKKGEAGGIEATGTYKIYKDALGDETHLYTELAGSSPSDDVLSDEANPDYLGTLDVSDDDSFEYTGSFLSIPEQRELASIISRYEEPDI